MALKVVERWLRRRFPPGRRVVVRWTARLTPKGRISHPPRKADLVVISIRSNLPEGEAVDTLQHEWAHLLTLDEKAHHGRRWGSSYRAIYARWHDEQGREEAIGMALGDC